MISTVPLNDPRLVSRAEHAFSLLPPAFRKHAVLAGGALRGVFDKNPTKDYDFFFLDTAKGKECDTVCENLWDVDYPMYQSKRISISNVPTYTTLLGEDIQIIFLKEYPDVASLLNEFDFTCCCIAATYTDTGISVVELPGASRDAAAGLLVPICKQINGKDYLSRVDKFIKKGYTKTSNFDELLAAAPTITTVLSLYDDEDKPEELPSLISCADPLPEFETNPGTTTAGCKLSDLYYEPPSSFIVPPKFIEDSEKLKKLAAQLDNKQFKKSMASLADHGPPELQLNKEPVTLESLQTAVAELKSTKEQILKNAVTVDVYPYKVSSNVSEQKQFPAFWDTYVKPKSSKESTK